MSEPVKLSIIYYSSTGTGYSIARELQETAEKEGAEVRLRKVAELAPAEAIAANPAWAENAEATKDVVEATPDDIVWADAVIFGSPTRYGNIASQLKQFIDQLGPQWAQGLLADKVYSGFTSTSTLHGGQESTLLALSNTFYHFGGFIVPPGYTDPSKFADGNPYGTSHVNAGDSPVDDVTRTAAQVQARRVVRVAAGIKTAEAA